MDESQLVDMTAEITKKFVRNHRIDANGVATLIKDVHQALSSIANPEPVAEPEVRAARKITRRKGGKAIGADNGPIVDEKEAEQALVETVDEDTLPDEKNIVGQRYEPMFED